MKVAEENQIKIVERGSRSDPQYLRRAFHRLARERIPDAEVPAYPIRSTSFSVNLLGKTTPGQFSRTVFEKKPFFRHGFRAKLTDAVSLGGIVRALMAGQIPKEKIGIPDLTKMSQVPADFWAGYLEGKKGSILLRDLDATIPSVGVIAGQFEAAFQCDVVINGYITPPRSQTLNLHWDDHDVFILQISGDKSWDIYSPVVHIPMSAERERPLAGKRSRILKKGLHLKKGSVLYLPRGFPHEAVAKDSWSFHLTVGLYPLTGYRIGNAMTRVALESCKSLLSYRRSIPKTLFQPARSSADYVTLLKYFKKSLKHAIDEVTDAEILEQLSRPASGKLRVRKPRREAVLLSEKIEPEAAFGLVTEDFSLDLAGIGGRIRLSLRDKSLLLPFSYKGALLEVLQRGTFRMKDLKKTLPNPEEQTHFIAMLVRVGLLELDNR